VRKMAMLRPLRGGSEHLLKDLSVWQGTAAISHWAIAAMVIIARERWSVEADSCRGCCLLYSSAYRA
jgi:hypothetical protein